MRNKFLAYCVGVALLCSLASWASLDSRARGGNSWHSGFAGSGRGWAGGGHK